MLSGQEKCVFCDFLVLARRFSCIFSFQFKDFRVLIGFFKAAFFGGFQTPGHILVLKVFWLFLGQNTIFTGTLIGQGKGHFGGAHYLFF
jgi:hypothetical protein